jgi:diguanylate cyclase (GGDEF)-like protein
VQEVWAGELVLDLPSGMPWPIEVGAAGRCARAGAPQLIADVERDPDYVPGNLGVRSEYLVPIRHRARLHGVLNLESTRADFFSPEVCAVFDAIAIQIAGAIHVTRLAAELEQANRKLQQLSMSDGLTGVANRRCFDLRLAQEWERHARERSSLALLLLDVDSFKPLNDVLGHLQGDEILREIARLCAEAVAREDALLARYGGEEFALLLPATDLRRARRIAERLRRHVAAQAISHPASEVAPHVTISVGASAVVPRAPLGADALVATADRALYAAKARGRDRVVAGAVRPAIWVD